MQTVSYPVAPAVTKRRGSLLDAATVSNDFAWLDGEGLFDSYNCMTFGESADFCAPNTKDLSTQSPVWQDGFRFAAWGGVTCGAIGLDQSRMLSEVERVFEAGESTAVERALLEGFAASLYVGTPTLHLPIAVASTLAATDGIVADGNTLRTKLGSKVAAGAGYDFPNTGPTGAEAAAGEKWLYATGEVWIGRGEIITRQVMAHTDNEVSVLAERGYIAALDCFAAAIRVTME